MHYSPQIPSILLVPTAQMKAIMGTVLIFLTVITVATWVTEGILLTAGKWYYEFEVLGNGKADGCPQIGWADSAFHEEMDTRMELEMTCTLEVVNESKVMLVRKYGKE